MPPTARRTDVIVQEVGPDTVVYDRLRDAAHSLNPVTGYVYKHVDGASSVDELTTSMSAALGTPVDPRVTEAALWQLDRVHLLERMAAADTSARAISRRQAVQRFGMAALSLAAVTSIVAPTPAMAQSGGGDDLPGKGYGRDKGPPPTKGKKP